MQAGKLRQLDHRPSIVLTALRPYSDAELKSIRISAERGKHVQALWIELQAEQARWSSRGEHRLVPGAGHNNQLDAPSEVINATLRVVDLARKDGAGMSAGRHGLLARHDVLRMPAHATLGGGVNGCSRRLQGLGAALVQHRCATTASRKASAIGWAQLLTVVERSRRALICRRRPRPPSPAV